MRLTKINTKDILGPMRIPFLILTPVCVFLGLGTAITASVAVVPFDVFMVLFGAVMAHISVNAFNEYFDFRSGLDLITVRTPFSGGSGAIPLNPSLSGVALLTAVTTLVFTVFTGFYFLIMIGPTIVFLGLVGIVLIVVYTPILTRHPMLCLFAPGLGFGPLMVLGTHLALGGSLSSVVLLVSMIPFFLVGNLLLLNQFPDTWADRTVGRRHLPIVAGKQISSLVFCLFLVLAYGCIIAGVYLSLLPYLTLIALSTLVPAVPLSIGVIRNADNNKKLLPLMGLNVVLILVMPTMVFVGMIIG